MNREGTGTLKSQPKVPAGSEAFQPKVLAGIVTYQPDLRRLRENIEAIVPQADRVVIVDNESGNLQAVRELVSGYPEVSLICNGRNEGIAFAMNRIGDAAKEAGAEYFMTLDQDSVAGEKVVAGLTELFSDETVGGASPYIHTETDPRPEETVQELRTAISSGFMVRTVLWEAIGGFWEFLFIDEVDHEFCFQIRRKGYRILRRNDVEIVHSLGETQRKKVLGHTFTPNNHSAFRRYYIARNSVIMKHLYPEEETGAFAHRYRMLGRMMVSILVCEEQKGKKIRAMLRGIRDGRSWCRRNAGIGGRRNR